MGGAPEQTSTKLELAEFGVQEPLCKLLVYSEGRNHNKPPTILILLFFRYLF